MKSLLVSIGVGVGGAAAIMAAGWALQAEALPPPPPAARVAADAAALLGKHHFAVDVFHVNGRRFKAACLEGWFSPGAGRQAVRGSLISFQPGPLVLVGPKRHVWVLRGSPIRVLPVLLAAAAGCPNTLAATVAHPLPAGDGITAARSDAANQPAIELRFPEHRHERLTLYLSPQGNRPLLAVVSLRGKVVTARLYLGRAGAATLRRFGIVPARRPKGR